MSKTGLGAFIGGLVVTGLGVLHRLQKCQLQRAKQGFVMSHNGGVL